MEQIVQSYFLWCDAFPSQSAICDCCQHLTLQMQSKTRSAIIRCSEGEKGEYLQTSWKFHILVFSEIAFHRPDLVKDSSKPKMEDCASLTKTDRNDSAATNSFTMRKQRCSSFWLSQIPISEDRGSRREVFAVGLRTLSRGLTSLIGLWLILQAGRPLRNSQSMYTIRYTFHLVEG